jgi:hypothetical protein
MSSSIPIPNSINIRRIRFQDNSELVSASQFNTDIRLKKRLRVDQESNFYDNVNIDGNLILTGAVFSGNPPIDNKEYVDNQTGWGLTEWDFAGAVYNPQTDSLIIKIYQLEVNYASIAYVDSKIQNTSSKYLVAKDINTVPTLSDPSTNFQYPATVLSSNSMLYIKDTTNGFAKFVFANSPVIGHVLKCKDNEGTVEWQPEQSTANSAQTISTTIGSTNTTASLKVIDSSSSRGFFFFPVVESNLYNKAITASSSNLLLGNSDFPTSLYQSGIGCYSHGSEYIEFQGSTSTTSQNGHLKLTGGSSTKDQQISLESDGLFIHPRKNNSIHFIMPYVEKNLPLNKWTKPVRIFGKSQPNDEFPTLKIVKEDLQGLHTSILFNPRSSDKAWSELVEEKNPAIIFGDTTNYAGDVTSFPSTKNTLVIAPWSGYGDGIQIRTSLLSEANSQLVSGFTRITGASLVTKYNNEIRVPAYYVEVNKSGIVFKNHTNTTTTNYGPFSIKSKTSAILNDPSTTSVTASFTVGESSNLVSSNFYGDTAFNAGSLFYRTNPQVDYVLTCTSETGKIEWKQVKANTSQATEFTGGVTFKNVATVFKSAITAEVDVNVAGKLSFNSFDSNNILRSVNCSSTGFSIHYNSDIVLTTYYNGMFLGAEDPMVKNFDSNTTYYSHVQPTFIGSMTIPPNYNNRIQINVPFNLTHNWCFRGNNPFQGEYNMNVIFKYFVEKVSLYLYLNQPGGANQLMYTLSHTNSSPQNSTDLGYFKVKYERNKNPEGPQSDEHTQTHQFTFSNPHFQFTLPKIPEQQTFHIYVQFHWSFRYDADDDRNKINSYWGSDVPSHYFPDWKVVLNQSFPSYWYSQDIDNKSSNPTPSTIHDVQYTEKIWIRPFYPPRDYFSWGSYYGNLPWGQVSLLNNDKIVTETKLLCGIGQFNQLLISGDVQSTGVIQCRGYMGRPGLGSGNSNPNVSYVDMMDINALSSNHWFNQFWTGEKVETWVDNSKILSQSPNVSDYRIKFNLVEAPDVLAAICTTSIYQFDIHFDMYHTACKSGVLAHEIQENLHNFPHLVNGLKDAVDENGKIKPQTIDYQELTIILMKGIQELNNENNKLSTQIEELKAEIHEIKNFLKFQFTNL